MRHSTVIPFRADIVKAELKKHKYTYATIAEQIGYAKDTLTDYMARKVIQPYMLKDICKILDLNYNAVAEAEPDEAIPVIYLLRTVERYEEIYGIQYTRGLKSMIKDWRKEYKRHSDAK